MAYEMMLQGTRKRAANACTVRSSQVNCFSASMTYLAHRKRLLVTRLMAVQEARYTIITTTKGLFCIAAFISNKNPKVLDVRENLVFPVF